MKILTSAVIAASFLFIPTLAIAASNCQVQGNRLLVGQSETDHAWVNANTTCRIFRHLTSDLHPTVFLQPAHGHLTVARNFWSYTPNKGYKGVDQFTFGVKSRGGDAHRKIIMAVE